MNVYKIRVADDDAATIKAAADRMALPVATWLRMVALAAARRIPDEPQP